MSTLELSSRRLQPWRARTVLERSVLLCWWAQVSLTGVVGTLQAQSGTRDRVVLNDSHFHLTNYVQRGPSLQHFLALMGDTIGRVAVFGIPLQQEWQWHVSGPTAPTYYLHTDAPLYYYSFTDAVIAMEYRSLSPRDRARFDPMITGFNPADMYAADHIRRVIQVFPGVFSGIGEFTVHKEFVSDKAQPGPASLLDPALDSVLAVAGDIGLLVIVHNDMDVPFPDSAAQPRYLEQMKTLLRRHPFTTVIWAHMGIGRIIRPVKHHAAVIAGLLADPSYAHVYFDISWDVVAKYLVASPEAVRVAAALINQYPDRFLFGTDAVAPKNATSYLVTNALYGPLWAALSPEARAKVRVGNYERLFDTARRKVRAWESTHSQ
jgi:predicted TIM-barrel fold metal-dependent hydrolase